MRVITGTARGMKLKTLEGLSVRPTTDQVKESIFNIVQFEVPGARVLDLFAGSGQLGIEALSRGAACATFIDNSRESVAVVNENLEHTKLSKCAIVKNEDALNFLNFTKDTFDIAFLDPPYRKDIITSVLPLLSEKMSDGGVIICETAREEELPMSAGRFTLHREYTYGKIKLTVYRNGEENV